MIFDQSPLSFSGYTHNPLTTEALSSHTTNLKNHVTESGASTVTPCDVTYGNHNDVTSSFNSVKCETTADVRSYKSGSDVSNSGSKRSPTPSRGAQAQSPSNVDQ